jgi:hypothetical protein
MLKEFLGIEVKGHVKITDDLGSVVLDQDNAIHPQNVARVIARALSNESNYFINRMAFGNGGTEINAAYQITYKTPNDGQPPDTATWDSRLYHETYSEIINEGNVTLNPLLGTDPGSADANTGVRPGGGAVPADDPPTIIHVSGPGVRSVENTSPAYTSSVVCICVLNAAEPTGQYLANQLGPIQNTNTSNINAASFTFDELGLYTTGLQAIATSGYQEVNVGNRTALDNSGLLATKSYSFHISIDGGAVQTIQFTIPAAGGSGTGGAVLYGDIVAALLTGQANWNIVVNGLPVVGTPFLGSSASVNITNDGTFNANVPPAQTFGFLTFTSGTTGPASSVLLSAGISGIGTNVSPFNLFDPTNGLNPPTGTTLNNPVSGATAGVQNDPTDPENERERLLTHIIFSPITKAANRTFTITYTLVVSVARTPS